MSGADPGTAETRAIMTEKDEKGRPGRPTDYTPEIALRICERIADGESLRSICLDEDMPSKATVFNWLLNSEHAAFLDQYTRAREIQADTHVDDMTDIADDGTNDWMEKRKADGSTFQTFNGEHVQRSKLRVETRKWIAERMRPKKYGPKVDLNVAGSLQTVSDEAVDARIAELLRKAGVDAASGGAGEAEKP